MLTAQNELTDQVVFDYWQEKAAQMGDDPTATIRDLYHRDVEVDRIKTYLRGSDRVLDIGCGNGHSTLQYARTVREIVGADYSPQMIQAAGRVLRRADAAMRNRVKFEVADARELPYDDEAFTRVVMERCLINIPDRSQQVAAAQEAGRVLRGGELFLLAEVTLQGHERVNYYREMFGLSKLKVHWHNTYIDEPVFLDALSGTFEHVETVRFGMYGFLSKVLHPLLVAPDEPAFDAPLNEVAARIARQIPDFDGCSHQVLFVLRKR